MLASYLFFSNKQIENSNCFRSFTDYYRIIVFIIITHRREPAAGTSSLPVPLRTRNHSFHVDKHRTLKWVWRNRLATTGKQLALAPSREHKRVDDAGGRNTEEKYMSCSSWVESQPDIYKTLGSIPAKRERRKHRYIK